MEEENWFVRTRSHIGCFLSYDYPLPFIYILVYGIKLSSMLARMPSTTIERSSALSNPLRFHPTLRCRVLSLRDGKQFLEGKIAQLEMEALQELGAQTALDQKTGRRLPFARQELRSSFHPQASFMYFIYVNEAAAIDVGSEPSVLINPGNRKRVADIELWCTSLFVIRKHKHSYTPRVYSKTVEGMKFLL
jgi:hypothetical protein